MREEYLHECEMRDVVAQGIYCGLLMPKHVSEKFQELESEFCNKIQALFMENKDELLESSMTGVFPKDAEGKIIDAEIVRYASKDGNVKKRIELCRPAEPRMVDVYICDRKRAEEIAWEIWQEKHPDIRKEDMQ